MESSCEHLDMPAKRLIQQPGVRFWPLQRQDSSPVTGQLQHFHGAFGGGKRK